VSIDRDKILQIAQKLVDKKRYDKAIVEYQKLVAEDPGDVRTLLKIGDLYLKLEKYEEAIATYEQVGEYYYREGFSVKAIAVYKQIRGIIKRHATHLESRYGHIAPRLAEIYTQLGLTSDALAAYDEVASRLRQEGRERDALDIFKKVLDLDPQNPIAHLRVADSYTRLGDMGKAVERFGEAAHIMVKLGRHDDALKVLERLLEYRQEPQYARMAAQLYLERNGQNDGLTALAKLQLCFKADPKDLTTLATLARAFDLIGQPKKAIEVLKESARVAKEKKDDATFGTLMDTLLERAGDDTLVKQLDAARRAPAAPEVSTLADDDVQSAVSSMQPEVRLSDPPESLDEIIDLPSHDLLPAEGEVGDLFAARDSGDSSAVRRLAREAETLHGQGRLDAAIGLLRDGLRNLGAPPTLRQRLSDLLLEWGDQEGCIQEKLELAKDLAQGGSLDGAMAMLDEVLLLQPDHREAQELRWALGYGARTAAAVAAGEQGIEDLELNAPLQSYDVESGGVEQLLNRTAYAPTATHDGLAAAAIDEPFLLHDPVAYRPPIAAEPYVPPAAPSLRQLDEDALDQADGLAQRGRFDEARTVLAGQLQMLPNHPLILERMAEIEELAAAAQGGIVPPPELSYAGVPNPAYDAAISASYGDVEQSYEAPIAHAGYGADAGVFPPVPAGDPYAFSADTGYVEPEVAESGADARDAGTGEHLAPRSEPRLHRRGRCARAVSRGHSQADRRERRADALRPRRGLQRDGPAFGRDFGADAGGA
jgi:tetratricopeptide (TPR) repeat protein